MVPFHCLLEEKWAVFPLYYTNLWTALEKKLYYHFKNDVHVHFHLFLSVIWCYMVQPFKTSLQ
jgi:hypothetical protein